MQQRVVSVLVAMAIHRARSFQAAGKWIVPIPP
jgi:hypothetical protein